MMIMHWREKSFKSVPELPDIVNAKGQNRVMLIRVFYWILEMEKKFPRILHLEIYCLAMHMMIWLGPIKFRLVPLVILHRLGAQRRGVVRIMDFLRSTFQNVKMLHQLQQQQRD